MDFSNLEETLETFFENAEDWLPFIVIGLFVVVSIIKGVLDRRASERLGEKMKVAAQSIGFKYIEESSKIGNNRALHELKGSIRGHASRVYFLNEKVGKNVQKYTVFEVNVHGYIFPGFKLKIVESGIEKHLTRWFGGGNRILLGDPTVDESVRCTLTDVENDDDRMEKEQVVRQLLPMAFMHNLIPIGKVEMNVKGSSVVIKLKGFLADPIKFNRAIDVLRMFLTRI